MARRGRAEGRQATHVWFRHATYRGRAQWRAGRISNAEVRTGRRQLRAGFSRRLISAFAVAGRRARVGVGAGPDRGTVDGIGGKWARLEIDVLLALHLEQHFEVGDAFG